MPTSTHHARIVSPVRYQAGGGQPLLTIPVGPCLVEGLGRPWVDIVWGEHGQASAALPVDAVAAARDQGQLVLLD